MPVRMKCSCGARFQVSSRSLGKAVKCPQCGKRRQLPTSPGQKPKEVRTWDQSDAAPPDPSPPVTSAEPVVSARSFEPEAPPPSAFSEPPFYEPQVTRAPDPVRIDEDASATRRRRNWLGPLVLLLLVIVFGAAAFGVYQFGLLRAPTFIEQVVIRYLDAVQRGDLPSADRMAAVRPHRVIGKVQAVSQLGEPTAIAGSYKEVALFHRFFDQLEPMPDSPGHFIDPSKKKSTGDVMSAMKTITPALKNLYSEKTLSNIDLDPDKGLDKLIDALQQADQAFKAVEMTPEQIFDMNISYGEELQRTQTPLSSMQRELCERFADDYVKWNHFFGRDWIKIRSAGEFTLHEARVNVQLYDSLTGGFQSQIVTMRRFILGSTDQPELDTGWKVWDIQAAAGEGASIP